MDLLGRYSNQPYLLQKLSRVLERAADGDRSNLVGVVDRAPRPPRLAQDRLTSEDVDELIAAFKAGTPQHVLAERYSLGETTVQRLLRARGVRSVRLVQDRLTPTEVQLLIKERDTGVSVAQLAQRFGISASSVRRLCNGSTH